MTTQPHSLRATAAVLLASVFFLPSAGAQATDDRVEHQVLLELTPGISIEPIAQRHDVIVLEGIPQWRIWLVRATPRPRNEMDALVDQMRQDPDIMDAEPHRHMESPEGVQRSLSDIDLTVTASAFRNQDATAIVGTDPAHASYTGRGVTVAVLDTGMALGHPETSSRILGPGVDFASGGDTAAPQSNGFDDDWDGLVDESAHHGTHVTGLINLAAPDTRVVPVRILETDGKGTTFALAKGILHAMSKGADVINLSLSMQHDSKIVQRAIEDAESAGVVVVASAGNRGLNGVDFPAYLPCVITVAAADGNLRKAGFSSYGTQVALSAPGVDLLSTHGNENYAWWSGTSFATPLVTGGAALILEKYPGLSPQEVKDLLRSTARPDNNPPGLDGLMGGGVLDLDALARVLTTDRASLETSRDSLGTVFRWSAVLDANLYDVARGDVANLFLDPAPEGLKDTVELGSLTCIADDTVETDTGTFPDPDIPAPGQAFFYVFRDDAPDPEARSYGADDDGHRRLAGGMDCPPNG